MMGTFINWLFPDYNKKAALFSSIKTRADCLEIIRQTSVAGRGVSLLFIVFSLFVWQQYIILTLASCVLIASFFLMRLNSRFISISFLVLSFYCLVEGCITAFRLDFEQGKTDAIPIMMAVPAIAFWVAARSVEATFKLHGRYALHEKKEVKNAL